MPGKQVKRWDIYHRLRRKGYSKESAARIANSVARRAKRRRAKEKIKKHLPGQHDQSDHGNWARGKKAATKPTGARLSGVSPDTGPLWRGTDAEQLGKVPEVGDVLDLSGRSASGDKLTAQMFGRGHRGGAGVVIEFPPDTERLRAPSRSDIFGDNKGEDEYLVRGKFRVTSVKETRGTWGPVYEVKVQPVESSPSLQLPSKLEPYRPVLDRLISEFGVVPGRITVGDAKGELADTLGFNMTFAPDFARRVPASYAVQSPEGVVAHEYGHVLLHAARENRLPDSAIVDTVAIGYDLFPDQVRSEGRILFDRNERVLGSAYANRNLDELVAEAVAAHYYGKRSNLTREVVEMLKEWVKPRNIDPSLKLTKHLPGRHNQKDHGRWARGRPRGQEPARSRRPLAERLPREATAADRLVMGLVSRGAQVYDVRRDDSGRVVLRLPVALRRNVSSIPIGAKWAVVDPERGSVGFAADRLAAVSGNFPVAFRLDRLPYDLGLFADDDPEWAADSLFPEASFPHPLGAAARSGIANRRLDALVVSAQFRWRGLTGISYWPSLPSSRRSQLVAEFDEVAQAGAEWVAEVAGTLEQMTLTVNPEWVAWANGETDRRPDTPVFLLNNEAVSPLSSEITDRIIPSMLDDTTRMRRVVNDATQRVGSALDAFFGRGIHRIPIRMRDASRYWTVLDEMDTYSLALNQRVQELVDDLNPLPEGVEPDDESAVVWQLLPASPEQIFTFALPNGFRTEVGSTDSEYNEVSVSGTIYRGDDVAGEFEFSFRKDTYLDKLWIRGNLIKLYPEHQDAGFSDAFLNNIAMTILSDPETANRFAGVEFGANITVGGYAWAKRGFAWRNPPNQLFPRINALVRIANAEAGAAEWDAVDRLARTYMPGISDREVLDFRKAVADHAVRVKGDLLELQGTFRSDLSSIDVAMTGYADAFQFGGRRWHAGKLLLLGTAWLGYMRFPEVSPLPQQKDTETREAQQEKEAVTA